MVLQVMPNIMYVKIQNFDKTGTVTVQRCDGKYHTVNMEGWCSVARYYGWKSCEECDTTDGSVDCLHFSAEEMLVSAGKFLSEHVGEETDDPGWWDEECLCPTPK